MLVRSADRRDAEPRHATAVCRGQLLSDHCDPAHQHERLILIGAQSAVDTVQLSPPGACRVTDVKATPTGVEVGFQLGSADAEPSGTTHRVPARRAIITAGAYTNDVLRPLKLQLNIKVGVVKLEMPDAMLAACARAVACSRCETLNWYTGNSLQPESGSPVRTPTNNSQHRRQSACMCLCCSDPGR